MVVHAHDLSTLWVESRRLPQVQDQQRFQCKIPSSTIKTNKKDKVFNFLKMLSQDPMCLLVL